MSNPLSQRWLWTSLLVAVTGIFAANASAAEANAMFAVLKPSGDFDLRKFLAPFHSVVLHFPIGFLTLAAILELISLRNKSADVRYVIRIVVGLSALSAIVAAALGWFRGAGGGYENEALERHRWWGVSVTALSIVGFFILLAASRQQDRRRWLIGVYRVMLMGTLTALMIAGHQGGNLTHGANYLFEGAPDFLKSMLAEDEAMASADPVAADEKQKYFLEQVRPIFEQKCMSCHGEEKQKGGYRLDRKDVAFAGGKSEKAAIKPGQPLDSNLVRLILLPPEDDDVMPPSGKSVLTPEEIGKVVHWIKTGAVFVEKGAPPGSVPASTSVPAPTVAPLESTGR